MIKKFLNKLKLLPSKPGVYFFKKNKKILYIGKATSLRDRVKSYFNKDLIHTRGPMLVDMVFQADEIKWQETDSVLEALVLEANLIKKYQPKYNTKEKSDKSFNFVCITKESLPKVVVIREKEIKNHSNILTNVRISKIYGPFTSGSQLKEAMSIVRRIFPFLDDKSKNYLEFYKQINLVPDLKDRRMYLQNIKNIKLFFSGKKKKILQNLKKEMYLYAKNQEFEKASEMKRQIFALQHINDVALLKNESYADDKIFGLSSRGLSSRTTKSGFRVESYDVAHMSGKNMVGVMVVMEDGELAKNEYRKFKIKTQKDSNDVGALTEILERRFVHNEWQMPDLVVVDGGQAQLNIAFKVISNLKLDIKIVSVLKNEKHKPKAIMGDENIVNKYKREILLANSEAHRFAITYHKKMRAKNFLKIV